MIRIFEEATANISSEINLHSQICMFSGEEFAIPSAEWNRACSTSPPKLCHDLSIICLKGKNQLCIYQLNYSSSIHIFEQVM